MELALKLKYLFVLLLVILFAGATYEEIVSDKKNQLEYAEKQIKNYREIGEQKDSVVKELAGKIDSINAEINALNSILKNYENTEYLSPEQISKETSSIAFLEGEVGRIQDSFKKKVINMYKHGKNYDLELLFSSRSPNEYLRRNQYLQSFSQNRRKELLDLKSKKFVLNEKKKMVSLSVSAQRFYVESKRNEKSLLDARMKTFSSRKDSLDNSTKLSQERIHRYESQIINIQDYLNNLENYKDIFNGTKTIRLNYESNDLSALMGNLNYPVDAALISTTFGNYMNNATNTVSFNNGVDFSVAGGSKVYSVAAGIVTIVGELPFYGKCIIVKHENGYRTVYASLSETNVSPGESIKLNQVIGKSGETFDGQMLHFEIWKDVIPLNPSEWFRK